MQYTEQVSWILFLKFFDDYEKNQNAWAQLNWESYNFVLDSDYRRDVRVCPKKDWKLDHHNAMSWRWSQRFC
jgi:type I restriction enzyme M protein